MEVRNSLISIIKEKKNNPKHTHTLDYKRENLSLETF